MADTVTPMSITDLAVIQKTIEVACNRGAFHANEMAAVGQVYDRLSAFLAAVISQAEAEAKKGEAK